MTDTSWKEKFRKLYLWGAGTFTKHKEWWDAKNDKERLEFRMNLLENQMNWIAFHVVCDGDPKKWGTSETRVERWKKQGYTPTAEERRILDDGQPQALPEPDKEHNE